MTFEIGFVLVLLGVAVVCFSFEWVSSEVVALGLMLAFVFAGVLTPEEAFAGFASDTVILILGLLIMTTVLSRTGLMDMAGRQLLRATGGSEGRFLWLLMIAAGGLSSFMSNTAATALFVPIVLGVARRLKTSAGKFLLPLAFASILASSVSLIATSTNLVASGLMQKLGMDAMGMFELSPLGLPILVLGVAYLGLLGWRLIPKREYASVEEELTAAVYLGEILIMPGSGFAGKTLAESRLGQDYDLNVIRIVRADGNRLRPRSEAVLEEGDFLLVEAPHEALLRIKALPGIELRPEAKLASLSDEALDSRVVEALLLPGSTLIGKSLQELRFRERFGLVVLALQHGGRAVQKLSQVRLTVGDVLLLEGPRGELAALQDQGAFRLIGEAEAPTVRRGRAWLMAAIFTASLLAGIFKLVSLPVAVMTGAVLMLASRTVRPQMVYREVEWKVLLLIAAMLSVGAAMQESGAAQYIGYALGRATEGWGPVWLLAGFFAVTVGLSQPMSNQAAAALMLPVAVATAEAMGLNARAFAMTVTVASSCSYLSPLEPSCLIVYGPGGYRFRDFFIVGLPLTVGILGLTLWLVPVLWPL
ncbi:MAG TPA: SLC13 family permease [Verrucomicrobiales bacterium]|nr:SLC13 family permease [Verrucomicrobiales bacterium]